MLARECQNQSRDFLDGDGENISICQGQDHLVSIGFIGVKCGNPRRVLPNYNINVSLIEYIPNLTHYMNMGSDVDVHLDNVKYYKLPRHQNFLSFEDSNLPVNHQTLIFSFC